MAQQTRIRLGTKRLQVQSLASLSGLRIQHCCELWCRSLTWLGSCIPELGLLSAQLEQNSTTERPPVASYTEI